ncbi:MAG TPA: hypothetical protein VFZ66_20875 [Herpetosiphonaceae bacterium]
MTEQKQLRTPRGVILIATLLIIGAFFTGGVGLLVPTSTLSEAGLPRSLLLSGALITSVLAYGLLRMRRWAWGATLSFVLVQGYFMLLNTLIDGVVQYAGLLLLLGIGIYLLRPNVRTVFFTQRAAR